MKQFKDASYPGQWPLWIVPFILVLATLACGFGRADGPVMLNRLPTLTRTPLPTLTPTSQAGAVAVAAVEDVGGEAPGVVATYAPALIQYNDTPAAPLSALIDPAVDANAEIANQSTPTTTPTPMLDNNLSAATPTPANVASVATATPAPTLTPTPVPPRAQRPIPEPTATPTRVTLPTAAPNSRTAGWSFASTRVYAGSDEGLRLYGEMVNDTGSAQELSYVSGTFFDDQGQIIADQTSTTDYAPLEIIPPGGRVPFELRVNNIQSAANFELWAKSTPHDSAPRQSDFEFVDVNGRDEDDSYCLEGALANRGGDLEEYLVIAAILYDDQGNMLGFGDDYQADLTEIVGDTTLDFDICIESPQADITGYELRAWGR
ncbi:MAG: hypothetical protein DPW09_19665 [Anaerolineae bacterium]|nr:DUF3426 domain-containing protein [Anaerolineales bacterium]MCQ3975660.1 hypothetical protein [Anaerolineae bacterium]